MIKKKFKIFCFILLALSSGVLIFLMSTNPNKKSFLEPIRVACVGDSLTQSSGYPYELWKLLGSNSQYIMNEYVIDPDYETLSNITRFAVGNFGVGSTTVLLNTETPYMNTTIFQNSLTFQPDIVIIMLGTNDAQPNLKISNTSFVNDYIKLVSAFQELPSKPNIWVALPPPIFNNQSGKLDPEYFKDIIIPSIEKVAQETNSITIDLYSTLANYSSYFPDGVHPNNLGARIIAHEIYRKLMPENISNRAP